MTNSITAAFVAVSALACHAAAGDGQTSAPAMVADALSSFASRVEQGDVTADGAVALLAEACSAVRSATEVAKKEPAKARSEMCDFMESPDARRLARVLGAADAGRLAELRKEPGVEQALDELAAALRDFRAACNGGGEAGAADENVAEALGAVFVSLTASIKDESNSAKDIITSFNIATSRVRALVLSAQENPAKAKEDMDAFNDSPESGKITQDFISAMENSTIDFSDTEVDAAVQEFLSAFRELYSFVEE